MDLFWAILIVATVVLLLFAVIPSLMETSSSHVRPHPTIVAPQQPIITVSPATRRDDAKDRAMLDSHYKDARSYIPEDYPAKAIGACPYTKAPSTDLPLVDLPLCYVNRTTAGSGSLRLS